MGVRKVTRATVVGSVMFALCAAGVSDPASVYADVPCNQWRFDGYTEFDLQDGAKLKLTFYGPWIGRDESNPVYFPADGGQATVGGAIYNGIGRNDIYLLYAPPNPQTGQPTEPFYYIIGGVRDDGSAYGVMFDNQVRHTSTPWRLAAPLRCADDGG